MKEAVSTKALPKEQAPLLPDSATPVKQTAYKPKRKKNWWKYLLSIVIIAVYILPVYVLINMAFKTFTDLGSRLVWPSYLYFGNFTTAFEGGKLLNAFKNTIIITLGVVAIEVILGCMAAYPLARNRSKFNKTVMSFCMGIMMIPALSILVGVYTELVSLNGINHFWAVIAISSSFGLPLSIYLFSNFIGSIPVALDEAAAIDGAGILRTFWSIIMPQLKPVTVTVIILKGIGAWNDYLYPSYILQKSSLYTVVLIIKQYFGSADASSNLHGAAAVATLCILPIILVYLFLQKYFIQGQVDSAVK